MRHLSCALCELPVLEVRGQFQKLDSYYLDQGDPLKDSVGYWHTSCLVSSPYGAPWHDVRLRNYVSVRGYEVVARVKEWTAIRDPHSGEHLALSASGEFLSLMFSAGRVRRHGEGVICRVEEPEYNLHLDAPSVILAVQTALRSVKTFPVLALFEALGIADRVHHPAALEGAMMHFEKALQRDWSDGFVSARWEYGVFVPSELEAYVRTKPLPRSY